MTQKKRTVAKYPKAFRKMALERLKSCESVTALSEELRIHRTLLYKWRDQMEAVESPDGPPANSRERGLRGGILAHDLEIEEGSANPVIPAYGSSEP